MKKNAFKLTEVKPRIFFLNFKSQYDCNMTFLRYQEHYESPNPKFRGKAFEIIDFMEWYSKKYGKGAFTYALDWAGFNIPGKVVDNLLRMGITDFNKYDFIMEEVWHKCYQKYNDEKFYIIGAVGESFAMKHEVAHGFFYTEPKYKKDMTQLVEGLNPKFRQSIYNTLEEIGYTPKVFVDECQAYLSTGLTETFTVKLKDEHKPFVELYDKFYNRK